MEKLKIKTYTDAKFSQQYLDTITLSINPESLRFVKGITYQEDKQLGSINTSNAFNKYKPETLAFDCIIDCTGVVEGTKEGDKVKSKVEDIEKHLFLYNSEAHRPSFVTIAYGEMLFKGQLTSIKEDYTLFNSQGTPLRADLKLEFSGYQSHNESNKSHTKLSPDMSRVIVMKEGDTLSALCYQIYGSALYVNEVARFNDLNGFREVSAGTKILFPPLKKN